MTTPNFPPILTVQQAARLLQLEEHKVYDLVRFGHIPAFRAGRAIRISRDKLLETVAQGTEVVRETAV